MPKEASRVLKGPNCILHSSEPIGAHDKVIWLSSPQGAPSGVCTGHVKPQDSGSNFLTVVVFISVKY